MFVDLTPEERAALIVYIDGVGEMNHAALRSALEKLRVALREEPMAKGCRAEVIGG